METALELLRDLWPIAVILVVGVISLILTREKKQK